MCTISLVSSLDRSAVRLLVNRDERRCRPVARPPALRSVEGTDAVWPTDPVGEGTWVAANARGVAFALLNLSGHRTTPGMPSRGAIIPALVSAGSIAEVIDRWTKLDTHVFAPCRLVVASARELVVATAGCDDVTLQPMGRAHVFSSSSLGDELVEEPRRRLLAEVLRTSPDPWMAQTRFHHHAWPDRRHISVMMSRPEACTVSCTEVVLTTDAALMHYRPVVDGWPVSTVTRTLATRTRFTRAA